MKLTAIHLKDALRLLEGKQPHRLRLWKLSTGDILTYEGATCVGGWKRKGTHKVRLPMSGLLREFRDVTLFEIDDLKIFLCVVINVLTDVNQNRIHQVALDFSI